MSLVLDAVTFAAADPSRLADFWADLLGWDRAQEGGVALAVPADGNVPTLRFALSRTPKLGLNQTHLEILPTSAADQEMTVAHALELGGTHLDIGQTGDEGHVVLGDPEGNELCVMEPGNRFLAGCPRLANVNADGSEALGRFWAAALERPLVWDQDGETALRSSDAGPMMAWGGPPVAPRLGKNRLRLDVAPSAGEDLASATGRLLQLGASALDVGQGEVPWVVLADPDGNELCVHPVSRRRPRLSA